MDDTVRNNILRILMGDTNMNTRHMEHIISSDTGMPVFYNDELIRQLFNDVSEEMEHENNDKLLNDPYLYRIGVIDE